MGYKKKTCACGCGRVGHFAQYATNACRQKSYRERKKRYADIKAKTVSSWLIDMFGHDACEYLFAELNQIPGYQNNVHLDNALEQLVYLTERKIQEAKIS